MIPLLALAGLMAETRPVRLVYYHPSDLPPYAGAAARMDKVLKNVTEWYADQMAKNGYGRLTFHMDRNPDGTLRIIDAKGELPLERHGREKQDAEESIHRVVREAEKREGLDPDRETVLVVTNLLIWKDGRNTEVGPFYGSGNTRSGECWVFDDPLLDPDKLTSKEPGGYYVRGPISIGKFNTTYIGGIAHEMGHCFGLPHERETPKEHESFGTGIMGPGNHTYREELRGEGKGTFMTRATAFPLSLHPCLNPKAKPFATERKMEVSGLTVKKLESGALEIQGKLNATPKIVGIVGFDDPAAPGHNDDDSMTAVVKPKADGTFTLRLPPPVVPNAEYGYQLRIAFYHEDGEATRRSAGYTRTGGDPSSGIAEELQKPRSRRRG
jgi:hypothetical protein